MTPPAQLRPLENPLPKTLNGREFAMENYFDEGFEELAFGFTEYLDTVFHKKEKVAIIGEKLIEERGNLLAPESNISY